MTKRLLTTLLLTLVVTALTSVSAARADIGTVDEMAQLFEKQWNDVESLRIEYSQLFRSKTTNDNYDGCTWEVVGDRARIIESRQSYIFPPPTKEDEKKKENPEPTPREALKTIEVHSECYYDGHKTYELVEPLASYPLEDVKLEDYYQLRRQGVRANVSNLFKHWRFWSLCPLPRYFSVPSEHDLLPLTELVKKYKSRLVSRVKNERAEEIVQLEIKDEVAVKLINARIKSWTLYLSFNLTKGGALSGYQLTIIMEREDKSEAKIINEYYVEDYKQATNGVWFPTNVEMRVHSPFSGSSLVKTRIRSVSINLPSDNFDVFHFPAHMVVTEDVWPEGRMDEKQKRLYHIWGDADAPSQTFDNEEAFLSFYEGKFGPDTTGEVADESEKPLGRRARLLIFVGVGFVAIVALFGAALLFTKEKSDEDD